MQRSKSKWIPYAQFKKIYSMVPRLTVEIVLLEDGKLFLTRRSIEPAKGKWHTPGGTVMKGESLRQAVVRHAKEETGMTVVPKEMLGVIEYAPHKGHDRQDISIAFRVARKRRASITLDHHTDAYDFFDALPRNMVKDQKTFYKKNLKMGARIKK